jgi:hypothetical protein
MVNEPVHMGVFIALALYVYRALPIRWSVNDANDGRLLQVLQSWIELHKGTKTAIKSKIFYSAFLPMLM